MLPFGLNSALLIFSAIGGAIEWITRKKVVEPVFHYVDNFIVVDDANSSS